MLTIGTAVHKQQIVASQRHWKLGQEALVLLRQCCGCPMVGSMPPTFGQLRWITAFTGIQSIDDVFIPAALTGGNVALSYQCNHFVWLGSITNEVTKAGDRFDALCVNVVEDGLNSRKVGVKAGDHSMFHGVQAGCGMACCCRSCCCCISRTSSARRQSLIVDWIPSGFNDLP